MSDEAFEQWIQWELLRPFLYLESLDYIRNHPADDFSSWESELVSA